MANGSSRRRSMHTVVTVNGMVANSEEAMSWLSQFASSEDLDDNHMISTGGDTKKEAEIRWTAEVSIGIMSKIFAAPRRNDKSTVVEQEREVLTACG